MTSLTKYVLWFVVVVAAGSTRANDSCAAFFQEGTGPEMKVSIVAGRAIIYRGHPNYGAETATRCLFSVFDRHGSNYAVVPSSMVSDALLAILIVDPAEWLDAAAHVEPEQVDAWLKKPLLSAQLQPMGKCPRPDRFEQASRSLGNLVPSNASQEQLRLKVEKVLVTMHCEEED